VSSRSSRRACATTILLALVMTDLLSVFPFLLGLDGLVCLKAVAAADLSLLKSTLVTRSSSSGLTTLRKSVSKFAAEAAK
jgi:hypothetical protein